MMLRTGAMFAAAITASLCASMVKAETPFVPPVIEAGHPADRIAYEGEAAKELARQVLPAAADTVMRAEIWEEISRPLPLQPGFTVSLLSEMELVQERICVQPVINLTFRWKLGFVPLSVNHVVLDFSKGAPVGYMLGQIQTGTRYHELTGGSPTPEAALDACLAEQDKGERWEETAASVSNMAKWRSQVIEALPDSPSIQVECAGMEVPACEYDQAVLIQFLQESLPLDAEHIHVPGEGSWTVFRWYVPEGTLLTTFVLTADTSPKSGGVLGHVRLKIEKNHPISV